MPALLAALRGQKIKATFFVLGDRLESDEGMKVLRQAYRDGHEIALHGYHHRVFTSLTDAEIEADVSDTISAIRKALGPDAKLPTSWYIRTPWAKVDLRVLRVLKKLNCRVVMGSVVPGTLLPGIGDRRIYNEPTGLVIPRIMREIEPGDIIALHAGEEKEDGIDRVWNSPEAATTALALGEMLIPQGYQFVSISELDQLNKFPKR